MEINAFWFKIYNVDFSLFLVCFFLANCLFSCERPSAVEGHISLWSVCTALLYLIAVLSCTLLLLLLFRSRAFRVKEDFAA